MILPWYHFVFLMISIISGTILFSINRSRRNFEVYGKIKLFFTQFFYLLIPTIIFGIPYFLWISSGFVEGDARNAETMMENQFLAGGDVISADANFIVTSHKTMKGHVQLQFNDGSVALAKCTAEMGSNGKYLIDCE